MSSHDTRSVIAGILGAYKAYDQSARAEWALFHETQSLYRAQQLRVFARLMREAGREDLSELRIVDIRCGTGDWCRHFAGMGAEPASVAGIDIRLDALRNARHLAHSRTAVVPGDGIHLPFPDGGFDLVTQFVVFSSIPDEGLRSGLAAEMVRITKPNGRIFWWDTLTCASWAGGAATRTTCRQVSSSLRMPAPTAGPETGSV